MGHCAVTDLANEAARNPHGMLMRLPLTAALAPLVHPRGGSGTLLSSITLAPCRKAWHAARAEAGNILEGFSRGCW